MAVVQFEFFLKETVQYKNKYKNICQDNTVQVQETHARQYSTSTKNACQDNTVQVQETHIKTEQYKKHISS